jgi:inosine-uridine nucleoside N-ribohydrolase
MSSDGRAGVQKVIFDTDIGSDVDDAYALTLLVSLRNVRVLGVTTVSGPTERRAQLAAKLLMKLGRPEIPVYAGRRSDQPMNRQYEWARGFRSTSLKKLSAVKFLHKQIQRAPGEITLIAVGPLTNLGDLFTRYPETIREIKRIVVMGGAVSVGYNNKPPAVPEHNIKYDPISARAVFASGAPLTMAGLDATAMMQLDEERQKKLFALGTPGTDALAALTNLWGDRIPTLFDPMAVAYALGHRFADDYQQHVVVDDDGLTRTTDGPRNVTILLNPQKEAFLDWYIAVHAAKR